MGELCLERAWQACDPIPRLARSRMRSPKIGLSLQPTGEEAFVVKAKRFVPDMRFLGSTLAIVVGTIYFLGAPARLAAGDDTQDSLSDQL